MATPTIQGARLRIDELLENLQTPAGRKLLEDLRLKIKPRVESRPMLEPADPVQMPEDRFEQAVIRNLTGYHIRGSDVPAYLPSAVLDALQEAAGGASTVDANAVLEQLGPQGLKFLNALSRVYYDGPADPLEDRNALDKLSPHTTAKVLEAGGFHPPELEALNYFIENLADPDEFDGFQFFGLQHLFMSSASLFDGFNRTGIPFEDMRFIGKIYSTNFRCAAHLEHRGSTIDAVSRRLPTGEYGREMDDSIHWQLKQMVVGLPRPPEENPEPQILLIDDGGRAIEMLNTHPDFKDYAQYFVCVEQTRKGAKRLRNVQLKSRVINVAECWAKLIYESPMIGHSVMLEVTRKLTELELYGVDTGEEAVVIGYGAVGQAVAAELRRRGFTVHVYDDDPKKLALLPDDMIGHTSLPEALGHSDVVVSCAGERTLSFENQGLLKDGAILFNAASADTELGTTDLKAFQKSDILRDAHGYLWGRFKDQPICLEQGEAQAHSDTIIKRNGKEMLLVNNGFVVNMTGERDPIPARYIQLTRALLFLGAVAARRGLDDIPEQWQRTLVNLVQRILKRTGESLEKPNWERKGDAPPPPIKREVPPQMLAPEPNDHGADIDALVAAERADEIVGAQATTGDRTGETVYGYRLGPVEPKSFEAAVNDMAGTGNGVLTVEEAALHQAVYRINEHFDASMVASVDKKSGAFGSDGPTEYTPSRVVAGEPPPLTERFESLYSHFSVELTRSHLRRKLRRSPLPQEVAPPLRAMFGRSGVPLRALTELLRERGDIWEDQALLEALRA